MPELDAEHRDQLAEALCAALDGRCPGCLPIAAGCRDCAFSGGA